LEDEGAVGNVILKWIFKKEAWGAWSASICFRRGNGGALS